MQRTSTSPRQPLHRRLVGALLALTAAGALLAASPATAHAQQQGCAPAPDLSTTPNATTVAGRFTYLTNDGQTKPVAHDNIEIWSFRPRFLGIWTWGKDATTTTNSCGDYRWATADQTRDVTYAIRVTATNYAARVFPPNIIADPFWVSPGVPDGAEIKRVVTQRNQVLDFTYQFNNEWYAKHFDLADTLRRGYDFVQRNRLNPDGDPMTRVDARLTSINGTTFYDPIFNMINLDGSNKWARGIQLHEYGHAVNHRLGTFFSMPASHSACSATLLGDVRSPAFAFQEGFASWFSTAVAREDPAAGNGHPYGVLCPTDQEKSEANTYSALASLTSRVQGGSAAVLGIVDRELDGVVPTLRGVRDAWIARGLPAQPFNAALRAANIGTLVEASLSNPSFEEGTLSGWNKGNFSTDVNIQAYNDVSYSHQGSWFQGMNTSQPGGSMSQDVPIAAAPGRSWTFTAWVRSADGSSVAGTLALWALGGDQESAATPFTVDGTWKEVSVTLSPTRAGHVMLRSELYLGTTGHNLDIDDTSLVEAGLANASFELGTLNGWRKGNLADSVNHPGVQPR